MCNAVAKFHSPLLFTILRIWWLHSLEIYKLLDEQNEQKFKFVFQITMLTCVDDSYTQLLKSITKNMQFI